MSVRALSAVVIRSALIATLFTSVIPSVPSAVADTHVDVTTTIALKDVTRGTLLFRSGEPGRYTAAPTLHSDVSIQVTGPVVRAVVTQYFRNPGDTWMEGVYAFPLPEQAAVDHLRMRIGERVIDGQVQERQQAARTYQRAAEAGAKAALIEEQRPNLFTTRVANIGPGESVAITIEYQDLIKPDAGIWRLRLPLAIGPRYIPGRPLVEIGEGATAEARLPGFGLAPDTDQVPDASHITPPMVPAPGAESCVHEAPMVTGCQPEAESQPVHLTVEVLPGFPMAAPNSPSHDIVAQAGTDNRWQVRFRSGAVMPDRDFELQWQPLATDAPAVLLAQEPHEDATYGLLMITPPHNGSADAHDITNGEPTHPHTPRELIFVIDTSGSMAGASLAQAQAALRLALARLSPEDRFNLIQFNSVTHRLFPASRAATPAAVTKALDYVAHLQANGGTEMLPALTLALDGKSSHERLRQIVFLTDGQAGNEPELLRMIQERIGDSRLFTVGIGSAPNSYFMRHAAEFGRGTFTYIPRLDAAQIEMSELFRKIERPALTNLAIDRTGWEDADLLPGKIPDVYDGESVVMTIRARVWPRTITLTGQRDGTPWRTEIAEVPTTPRAGLSVSWGRQKIRDLSDELDGTYDAPAHTKLKAELLTVALRHHLVSRVTSLVAVDVTPTRPAGESLDRKAVPSTLPHGQTLVGGIQQTATPAAMHLLIGLLVIVAALGLFGYGQLRTRQSVG
ncbi:MAG: marine proteobacterial sortase target protein [Nitrospiraceae bacterium]